MIVGDPREEGSKVAGYHRGAGKSSFFDENDGFRSEGLQKSENAVLVPPWRIENPLQLHAICMQCSENLLRFEAHLIRQLAA